MPKRTAARKHWPESGLSCHVSIAQRHPAVFRHENQSWRQGDRLTGHSTSGSGTAFVVEVALGRRQAARRAIGGVRLDRSLGVGVLLEVFAQVNA
jgi:hypothetical protein